MSKLDTGYITFYKYYFGKGSYLSKLFDQNDDKCMPEQSNRLVAPFQVFLDMGEDFIDTFKPYKSADEVERDYLQPYIGFYNISQGLVSIIAPPIVMVSKIAFIAVSMALGFTIGLPCYFLWKAFTYEGDKDKPPFENFTKALIHADRSVDVFVNRVIGPKNLAVGTIIEDLKNTPSWMLDGATRLLRGLSQVATAPLTWFIKMPLRGIITAFSAIFVPKKPDYIIEDAPINSIAGNPDKSESSSLAIGKAFKRHGRHNSDSDSGFDVLSDVEDSNYDFGKEVINDDFRQKDIRLTVNTESNCVTERNSSEDDSLVEKIVDIDREEMQKNYVPSVGKFKSYV